MNLKAEPLFFPIQSDFRKWLLLNHEKAKELLVGYYKVNSGKPSMSWSESVDQALCFGWIDGIRKSIDSESYLIRFTPRKSNSIWSDINIKKVEVLTKQGLMQPKGLASFKLRRESHSRIYAYESEPKVFAEIFENRFKLNVKAWNYFQTLPGSYKRTVIHRIMSAKKESTQLRRFEELLVDCQNEKRIKSLNS